MNTDSTTTTRSLLPPPKTHSQLIPPLFPLPLRLSHSPPLILHPHNPHQLRLKNQRRPRRNRPHRPVPVPQLRRHRQRPLLPHTHVQQPLVPALDHAAGAQLEGQGLAAVVGGVELGAGGGEGAAVVDFDGGAGFGAVWAAGGGDGEGGFDAEGLGEGGWEEGEEEEGEEGGEMHLFGMGWVFREGVLDGIRWKRFVGG